MQDNHDRLQAAIASMRSIDQLLRQIAEALPQNAGHADAALLETLMAAANAAQGRFHRVAKQVMDAQKTLAEAGE
ncbi:MAG: hypothetical protein AB7F36_10415 [Reyranellaceae bacterium]